MKTNRILVTTTISLTLALIISIVLNYLLFSKGQQYYHQLNLTRLDPLGLSVYPAQDYKSTSPDKLRVVLFGDSRVYQWPQPTGLEGFEFINRGIGAQTSSQVVGRFDEHVIPLQPDILLIQMGINDLKTLPLFPYLKSWIVSKCKNNIKWTVQEARNQGATVILTTIFPLGKIPLERRLFWSEDVGYAIEEVNRFIYSLEAENVIIFDTEKVLADDRGLLKKEYSWDFLHLNEDGYDALNEKLIKILEELGQSA
jgi:lysophospholipase L1-like esterase